MCPLEMEQEQEKEEESRITSSQTSTRNNVHTTHLSNEPVRKDGETRKLGACFPTIHFSRPGAAPARKRILPIVARLAAVDDASA